MRIAVAQRRLDAIGQAGFFGRVLVHAALRTDDQFLFRFQIGLGLGNVLQTLGERLIELSLGTGIDRLPAGFV